MRLGRIVGLALGFIAATVQTKAAESPSCWRVCPVGPENLRIQRLENPGFRLGYAAHWKQSLWAAYQVLPLPKGRAAPWYRRGRFAADPRVVDGLGPWDLRGSGYDRGHLAPAFLLGAVYGVAASQASYQLTNIAPQKPRLNRLLMQRIEEAEAQKISTLPGAVFALSGPIFSSTPLRTHRNIAVPEHFFRVWLWQDPAGVVSTCAFLIPQTVTGTEPLDDYAVHLSEIERRSGLKLFPALASNRKAAKLGKSHRNGCAGAWPLAEIRHWPARYIKELEAAEQRAKAKASIR